MRNITVAAIALGLCKLGFSTGVLAIGKSNFALAAGQLQTLAFVTLVFGAQAVLFSLRERRHKWSSRPSGWVLASSATDLAIASALALSGTLMDPLPWAVAYHAVRSCCGLRLDFRSAQAAGHVGIEGGIAHRNTHGSGAH